MLLFTVDSLECLQRVIQLLYSAEPYENGLPHGTAKQWDDRTPRMGKTMEEGVPTPCVESES